MRLNLYPCIIINKCFLVHRIFSFLLFLFLFVIVWNKVILKYM